VYVVPLAVDLYQSGLEFGADAAEDAFERMQGSLVEYQTPVLGHKDQMDM
jgi:hypothetical protein